ncbi:unnamed protein product [Sphagnum balticum]
MRIHQQLLRASFKTAAESMWHVHLRSHPRGSTTTGAGGCWELHSRLRLQVMCICPSHPKGSSSNSCGWEVHSKLLLQVCASAYLTQKDPAAAVVGSFIQDSCKDVYISAISPKRILHLSELHGRLLLQGMCICPSQPKRIQQLALELH